ncbi:hypothetical protein [Arcobacter sp. s6]|jgi:hypothetical protein|uniref:hypothetical protein n=1 Tax=Arcobacter sp. s6 TaxID=3230363 RepID=UPI0034A010C8
MKKTFYLIILLNIFLSINLFAAKNLYLSYKKVPNQAYKNQKIEIIVKALITTDNFDTLSTSFSDSSNANVLNPNSSWRKVSNDTYENSYYFKIKQGNFKLPNISVKLLSNGSVIDISDLSSPSLRYSDIGTGDTRFSGVIADKFVLKAYKTKQYNNKEALTIIDVDALNSNLEDFKLQGITEQGISNIKDEGGTQNLVYYFVTPIYEKKVVITYYNLATKSFKDIRIPLILQNELVSTQTDLNPNDSNFEKYKKIFSIVIFVILLILLLVKRNKILMILTLFAFIIALLYNLPNSKGIVKKDSYIYILPTKNSTIFFKVDSNQNIEVLQRKNGFIKVLGLDNDFIGWIKEDSFETN